MKLRGFQFQMKQDKSSQLALVLSKLFNLQASMAKEKKRVAQIISKADLTIYQQKLQIISLRKENAKLAIFSGIGCTKTLALSRKTSVVSNTSARLSFKSSADKSSTVASDSGCDILASDIMSDEDGKEIVLDAIMADDTSNTNDNERPSDNVKHKDKEFYEHRSSMNHKKKLAKQIY